MQYHNVMTPEAKHVFYNALMSEFETIHVTAFKDDEAKVWVAESDNFKGLVTEADTLDLLHAKLERLIPELAELNYPELKGHLEFQLSLKGIAPLPV